MQLTYFLPKEISLVSMTIPHGRQLWWQTFFVLRTSQCMGHTNYFSINCILLFRTIKHEAPEKTSVMPHTFCPCPLSDTFCPCPLSDPFLQCQHHASLLLMRKQTDTILILGEITLLILAEITLSVNDTWESVKHMDWTQNCCFVTANLWVNKYASLEKKIKDYTPVALLIGAKLKVAVCGKQSTWTWLIYSMYIYYYYWSL